MKNQHIGTYPMDISDNDIIKAMKNISGYLDITPGDFKEIYRFAYRHAVERLRQSVRAKDVMTKDVVFVRKDASLEEVADRLNLHLISGVPVIDDDKRVVGVISEKDFLFQMGAQEKGTFMGIVAHCLKSKGCVAITMRKQKAEDIMTSPAITVGENRPIFEIANTFTEKNINRTPVVDQNNKLVGIVTRTDIVRSSCAIENLTGIKE
jgi:CBS domain-containing membrane protein